MITHLQKFLLELGRGFSFVARQKRIAFDGRHFRIDLVFYNYILNLIQKSGSMWIWKTIIVIRMQRKLKHSLNKKL